MWEELRLNSVSCSWADWLKHMERGDTNYSHSNIQHEVILKFLEQVG